MTSGKCSCGLGYGYLGANPPYTGFEWCEGAGVTEVTYGVDEDGEEVGNAWWTCRCREYDGPEPAGGWG